MRMLVNGNDVTQSIHARKRILLDTMILCYAHDRLSQHHVNASLIIKASISGLIKTYVSYQNLVEFYSIVTSKRVKKPLTPREAAEICTLYEKSTAITKLLPSPATYSETFESVEESHIVNGDIFDCVLAHTARGNVDAIWSENTQHFKNYSFLSAENPLEWKWGEE